MRVATRIFASNFNPKLAQRFYAVVLLPAIRDDIAANKKLNYHYYMALKKSVFKPSAFYRGILLPLALCGIDASWNRVVSVVSSALITFFLVGIEELGLQIEEKRLLVAQQREAAEASARLGPRSLALWKHGPPAPFPPLPATTRGRATRSPP